jgi:hypothetical protein
MNTYARAVLNHKVEKHNYSKCGGSMVFYDDPSLRRLKEGFYSGTGDDERKLQEKRLRVDPFYVLLTHLFKCPHCGRYTLQFEEAGNWD